jgi:thioesterase domain-containing protein/acyl carrier protein
MAEQNIEAIYPLSPSQQGMLFETLATAEAGIHIEQLISHWQGDIDLAAIEEAWQRVVQRHAILRTTFIWQNQDEPLQVVLRRVKVPLEWQDWRGFSSPQQQERLATYLRQDRQRGFKVTRAPLLRLALFQLGEHAYQCVWTFHHILMDGWCMPLILKEVLAYYEAFSSGQDVFMPPSRPYRDYIAWLKQQDLSQAETFWRKKLQGFTMPTPLGIPAAPGSFAGPEERYSQQQARLSASATAALQSLVRQHHLPLNTLIQGVWALLLNRYSGESDVVFGATVSGRPSHLAGVESMIGLFINTLPMRIKVTPDTLFWPWLQDIQAQYLEQQVYEYCSAGQVHQWSEMPGALPLYESILVFENYPVNASSQRFSDQMLDTPQWRFIGAHTKYALTLLVHPGAELVFLMIYDSSRCDPATIGWILEHWVTLLESIVAAPDQHLGTLRSRIAADQIPTVRSLQKHAVQERQKSFVPPRDTLEIQLVQIWEEVLDIHPVGIRDNFFDLGGYSLVAVRLMAQIQQRFGKNLPLATLFHASTIEQLAHALRQHMDSLPWSPLVAIQSGGSLRPFYCVPGAGGNPLYFYDLARHLGPDQPFYALQPVGLDGKSEPLTRIEDMASYNLAAIQAVQPQGPFLLGGHSFGAYVAFEMAQQLQKQGHEVALLAILDTAAPVLGTQPLGLDWDDARWLHFFAGVVENISGKHLEVSYDALQQLGPDEQLHYVIDRMSRVDLLPPGVGTTQIRGFVQVSKANLQARYMPQEVHPTRIILFRASEPPSEHALQETALRDEIAEVLRDPVWGWRFYAAGPVELHIVPGEHESLVAEPHVRVLAERLRVCLEQAQMRDMEK